MTKEEIRNTIKKIKISIPQADIEAFSNRIIKQVLESEEFNKCRNIFCYVSFNQEVRTQVLINTALKLQKKVAVPKIERGVMRFYFIKSLIDLQPGILGIQEPAGGKEALPSLWDDTLMIIPGLAFDRYRNRIGYGGGYYDNYLMKYSDCPIIKMALAFDLQILTPLPVNAHDIKVDEIVTQSGVMK